MQLRKRKRLLKSYLSLLWLRLRFDLISLLLLVSLLCKFGLFGENDGEAWESLDICAVRTFLADVLALAADLRWNFSGCRSCDLIVEIVRVRVRSEPNHRKRLILIALLNAQSIISRCGFVLRLWAIIRASVKIFLRIECLIVENACDHAFLISFCISTLNHYRRSRRRILRFFSHCLGRIGFDLVL